MQKPGGQIAMDIIEKYRSLTEEKKKIAIERINASGAEYGIYPLSKQQQGVWWSYCLEKEGENPYYNIMFRINMKNSVDCQACRDAVMKTVEDHDVFRYRFAELDGNVYQYTDREGQISFEYLDESQAGTEEDVRIKKDEFIRRPFDLRRELPARFMLIQKNADEALLLVSIHHIICDGWSAGVFLKQFFTYLDRREQKVKRYEPYSSFVLANGSEEAGERYGENYEFWKGILRGREDVLEAPTVFPRKGKLSQTARPFKAMVDDDLSSRVHDAAREKGTAVHALLLSVYSLLIWRYTGSTSFITGTPLAGREDPKYMETIGDFATTVALPVDIDPDDTYEQHLKKTQDTLFAGIEHQNITLSDLYEAAEIKRRDGVNPLFQISFAVQSRSLLGVSSGEAISIGGTEYTVETIEERENEDFRYDFCFTVYDSPDRIELEFLYNEALYDEARMKTLMNVYTLMLRQVLEAPDIKVRDLKLTTKQADMKPGEIAVTDEAGRRLPDGFEGSIVMMGENGLEDTGQYGCITEDGQLRINEDKSDAVDIDGHRVSLSELNETVREALDVPDARCVFVKAEGLSKGGYVILSSGTEADIGTLPVKPLAVMTRDRWEREGARENILKAAEIREHILKEEGVTAVEIAEAHDGRFGVVFCTGSDMPLPDDAIEDIRHAVRNENVPIGFRPGGSHGEGIRFYTARRRSADEDKIYSIWSDILGSDDFSIYDKFFEAGGNSMLAVKLFQRLNSEFDRDINIAALFSCNTIQEQAAYFKEEAGDASSGETEGVSF